MGFSDLEDTYPDCSEQVACLELGAEDGVKCTASVVFLDGEKRVRVVLRELES